MAQEINLPRRLTQEVSVFPKWLYTEDFPDSKRFQRYKNRFAENLCSIVTTHLSKTYESTNAEVMLTESAGLMIFLIFDDSYIEKSKEIPFAGWIREFAKSFKFRYSEYKDIIAPYLKKLTLMQQTIAPGSVMYQVMDIALVNLCIDNISRQSMWGKSYSNSETINEQNYFNTLPTTLNECLPLLHELFDEFVKQIVIYTALSESMTLVKSKTEEYSNELERTEKELAALKKQLSIKEKETEELKEKANVFEEKAKKAKDALLKEQNITRKSLSYENAKLQRELDEVKRRLEELRNAVEEDSEQNIQDTNITIDNVKPEDMDKTWEPGHCPDIDYTKRYVFVMDEAFSNITSKLNKYFTNSTYVSSGPKASKSSLMSADLVVLMVKYTKHSTMFLYRDFCRANKIPYVMCNYSGIAGIEGDIAYRKQYHQN